MINKKRYFRPKSNKRDLEVLIKHAETLDRAIEKLMGRYIDLHAEIRETMDTYAKMLEINELG